VIDLHCHLLPGVDDGSRTVEQSVRVLTAMRESGVTAVCLTPHLAVGRLSQGLPSSHDAAFSALTAAAPDGVELHRGVELMLDRAITRDVEDHPEVRLAGTRYILVEFGRLTAVTSIANALHQLSQLGLVPLLAHPERYSACTPDAVRHWKSLNAVMQVDATTILAPRGRGRRARDLLAAGLADVIAADNHGDDRMIGTAYRYLCEAGGSAQADLLARRNPAAILKDQALEPVPPIHFKTGLLEKLRNLLEDGE